MRSMEFSGPTVDAAIFRGLNEMGVTIDEVEIETIQTESKGLFGLGAKEAVVRLTEREIPVTMEVEAFFREAEKKERHESRRQDRPRRDRDGGRRNGGRRREAEDEPAEEIVSYDYSAEKAADYPCAEFLQGVLERMGISGKVLAAEVDDGLRLKIDAETDGLLIGRRGETLDALQYLTSLVANAGRRGDDYLRVTLDTEGYRARREATLRKLARRNAIRVCQTGRSIALEPMNPYERHIMHTALQDFTGVTTHSEGEEPNRRIVISPSNDD